MCIIEHRLNARDARDTNRPWRKPCIFIGIVRTIGKENVARDTMQVKFTRRILHRRISLQTHTFFIAIQIHTGNHWFLLIVVRLLLYY